MPKVQIDPRIALWVQFAYVCLSGLSATVLSAAGFADPQRVLAWAALIAFPLGVFLNLFSSSAPGPLAPQDPAAVKAATLAVAATTAATKALGAFLIVALCLGALPHQARAADNPLNAIASWASADVDTAIKAASLYPAVQDQVGAACLSEIKVLASMLKDHPLPVSLHLATDVEYARLAQGELNRLCRVPACAQVWSDMAASAKAIQVTPLPISFASICARVPVVGLSLGN